MKNKRTANFDFFLGHLYDEVSNKYDIDMKKTKSLVNYMKQFRGSDDRSTLNHLKNNADKENVSRILSEIGGVDEATKLMSEPPTMTDPSSFSFPEALPVGLAQHINYFGLDTEGTMKTANTSFNVPVSDSEKELARQLRKSFEKVLGKQSKFLKFLSILFEHLEELDDQAGLVKISPLIKKYEHKMKKRFNAYIREFSKALSVYENNFSDTEMDDIRDLIIENIRSMRELVIDLVVLLKDVGAEDFVQESLDKYNKLQELNEKLEGMIRDEWFGHIDYDILGKIRLGFDIPLSIKKRG